MKVYETKCARGCVVVVALHHGVPIFGKVEQILIDGEIVILRYRRFRVSEYVSHLNANKVVELNEIACIKQKELKDVHPLSLYKGIGRFSQDSFIVLRYRVDCFCNHFGVCIHDRIRHNLPFFFGCEWYLQLSSKFMATFAKSLFFSATSLIQVLKSFD